MSESASRFPWPTSPLPSDGGGGPERDFDVRYYTELLWRSRILLAATAIGGLALGILGRRAPGSRATRPARCSR